MGELLRLCHFVGAGHRPETPQSVEDQSQPPPSSHMLTWRETHVRVTLGRSENCDVRIVGETVSRLHCEIERVGQAYFLRDRSRNGTRVNGSRVDECQLQNGDWIQVGGDHLRVDFVPLDKSTDRLVVRRTVDPTSGLHAPEESISAWNPGERQIPPDSPAKVSLEGVPRGGLRVESAGAFNRWKSGVVLPPQIVIRGLEIGVTLQFWDSRITFGRWKVTQVLLDGEKISRIHAALTRAESAYILVDLESTNGTFVNEQRITRCVLQTGDRIRMGSYQAVVRLDQEDCLLHFQRLTP
jgi:pSer/pThr/pTyr-binding forkhead associated (FHA) protein